MVACKACGKANSLDSKFCRGCGAPLDQDELAAAEQENEKLVADGRKLFAEGRVEEARMVAEAAIQADPESVPAIALLGECLEWDGRLEEALEAFERIVQLQPTSALDRVKVQHLRRKLEAEAIEESIQPDQRRAIVAAVCAGLVLLVAGSALVFATKPQTPAATTGNGEDAFSSESFATVATNPPGPSTKASSGPQTAQPETPPTTSNSQPTAQRGLDLSRSFGGSVGRSSALPGVDGYRPVSPNIEILPMTPNAGTQAAPTPNPPASNPNPVPVTPDEPENTEPKGIVEIRPSRSNPITRGGGEEVPETPSATGGEDMARSARQDFMTGNYSRAATRYEQALRAGASPGGTNQRLAQSYEKLGRRTDAIAAHTRAIAAFEASLRRGDGDASWLRSAIASSRAAIQVLQR